MNQFLAYVPGKSPIHKLDARIKLLVLLAYSIALFFMDSWIALGVAALGAVSVILLSRISLGAYGRTLFPAAAILVFIWICNSFSFEGGLHVNISASLNTLAYILRIVLIILASFALTFTTTSTQITDAVSSLLKPLRALRVPVDDVAFTLSLALRFIPLIFEELSSIKCAQTARRASFGTGSIWGRFKAWMVVLIPLFVGFFRRAETIAEAMDARCYGASSRTSLNEHVITVPEWFILLGACVLLLALAIFL